jgi:hypothetical protein
MATIAIASGVVALATFELKVRDQLKEYYEPIHVFWSLREEAQEGRRDYTEQHRALFAGHGEALWWHDKLAELVLRYFPAKWLAPHGVWDVGDGVIPSKPFLLATTGETRSVLPLTLAVFRNVLLAVLVGISGTYVPCVSPTAVSGTASEAYGAIIPEVPLIGALFACGVLWFVFVVFLGPFRSRVRAVVSAVVPLATALSMLLFHKFGEEVDARVIDSSFMSQPPLPTPSATPPGIFLILIDTAILSANLYGVFEEYFIDKYLKHFNSRGKMVYEQLKHYEMLLLGDSLQGPLQLQGLAPPGELTTYTPPLMLMDSTLDGDEPLSPLERLKLQAMEAEKALAAAKLADERDIEQLVASTVTNSRKAPHSRAASRRRPRGKGSAKDVAQESTPEVRLDDLRPPQPKTSEKRTNPLGDVSPEQQREQQRVRPLPPIPQSHAIVDLLIDDWDR